MSKCVKIEAEGSEPGALGCLPPSSRTACSVMRTNRWWAAPRTSHVPAVWQEGAADAAEAGEGGDGGEAGDHHREGAPGAPEPGHLRGHLQLPPPGSTSRHGLPPLVSCLVLPSGRVVVLLLDLPLTMNIHGWRRIEMRNAARRSRRVSHQSLLLLLLLLAALDSAKLPVLHLLMIAAPARSSSRGCVYQCPRWPSAVAKCVECCAHIADRRTYTACILPVALLLLPSVRQHTVPHMHNRTVPHMHNPLEISCARRPASLTRSASTLTAIRADGSVLSPAMERAPACPGWFGGDSRPRTLSAGRCWSGRRSRSRRKPSRRSLWRVTRTRTARRSLRCAHLCSRSCGMEAAAKTRAIHHDGSTGGAPFRIFQRNFILSSWGYWAIQHGLTLNPKP